MQKTLPKHPPELTLRWSPVPRNPWSLRYPDGRLFRGFPSAELAMGWLAKNGYGSADTISMETKPFPRNSESAPKRARSESLDAPE